MSGKRWGGRVHAGLVANRVSVISDMQRSFSMTVEATVAPEAKKVIQALRAHEQELRESGIRKLSLFGSVARGDAAPDSDVDLLAELDPQARIGLFRLVGLEQRLSDLLGRPVDLTLEPVEAPRLRANVMRDLLRAF